MTLCIAAECEHEDQPAVVVCCDWRAQHGADGQILIGTDDVDKIREVGAATVLLAGSRTKADELVISAKPAILAAVDPSNPTEQSDLTMSALLTSLRGVARDKKTEVVRHFVQMETGIPFDDFIKQPTAQFEDIWFRVRQLTLDADLVVAFAQHNEAFIVSCDRFGDVAWRVNYWAIGEGASIARAFLGIKPWEMSGPLNECLYRVYEAKRAAHIAHPSSVGAETSMQVVFAGGVKKAVTQDCIEHLYDVFNLKHIHAPKEWRHLREFKKSWLTDGFPHPW